MCHPAQVEDRLAALNANLDEMQRKKLQLEVDVDMCEKKLERATTLIGGLGGEKLRWTQVAAQLADDDVRLTGDVLLSAGCIAYLGAFTAAFRSAPRSLCARPPLACHNMCTLQHLRLAPLTPACAAVCPCCMCLGRCYCCRICLAYHGVAAIATLPTPKSAGGTP